jgi:hypothetical protein
VSKYGNDISIQIFERAYWRILNQIHNYNWIRNNERARSWLWGKIDARVAFRVCEPIEDRLGGF